MLFMVIEKFRDRDPRPVGERFRAQGRMLPDDVRYHASWIDPAAMRCFQVMDAPDRRSLDDWVAKWDDLIEFDVVPIVTSGEFWATVPPQP